MLHRNTNVYPYCYRIKDDCLPCPNNKCLKLLAKVMSDSVNSIRKKKYNDELFACLRTYGNIYKQLHIELYVNPRTNRVVFPDMERIQANFNLYLKNIDMTNPIEMNDIDKKLTLYNVLLHKSLKDKYDEFFYSFGFSDSLEPKEYGIARILEKSENQNINGGKKTKSKTKKKKPKRNVSKKYYNFRMQ